MPSINRIDSQSQVMTDRPKRLLVIDDDEDIREALADLLRGEGFEVTTAANGADALTLLGTATTLPDVILLDLAMPVMDGFAFRNAQLADDRIAAIPVILVTAGARQARLAGLPVAMKPFDMDSLLAVIRSQVPQ